MTKKELIQYCREQEIFVPSNAPKEYLEAVIVKAAEHQGKSDRDTCFGYWMPEHASCVVCDLSKACSHVTIGMDSDKFLLTVERLENPKIRITETLRKKR